MTAQRFFYVLCGLLVLVCILGGVGYYYASQSLVAGTDELSHSLGDEAIADQTLSALQDLQKQHKLLTPLVPAINEALPSEKDETSIALQLHNLAAANGMPLNSLNFANSPLPGPLSQTVTASGVLALPITFQLNGSYQQLQGFLQGQEHLSRYTSVTSLGITTSGSGNLIFAITLDAFLKP